MCWHSLSHHQLSIQRSWWSVCFFLMKGCELWGGDQSENDEHYDDGQRVGGRPRPISTTPNRTKVQLLPDRRLLRGQLFCHIIYCVRNLLSHFRVFRIWSIPIPFLLIANWNKIHVECLQNLFQSLACCTVSDQMGIRHDRLPDGRLKEGAVHQDQEDPSLRTTSPAPGVWGEEQKIRYNLRIKHIRAHFQLASLIFVIIGYLGPWQLGLIWIVDKDASNCQGQ